MINPIKEYFNKKGRLAYLKGSTFQLKVPQFKLKGSTFQLKGSTFNKKGSTFQLKGSTFNKKGGLAYLFLRNKNIFFN